MKYLALCALFLCGCGDGRIVRALNSGPAYYPAATSSYEALEAKIEAGNQESQLRQIESEIDDLRNNPQR